MKRDEPLSIERMIKVTPFDSESGHNGSIYIESTSEITISAECGVSADEAGLRSNDDNICYQKYFEKRQQRQSGSKMNILLSSGFLTDCNQTLDLETEPITASGGIIALRSRSNIVNNGLLSSNGSASGGYGGGSICLCADGFIINRGKIECKPNGRIVIRCYQFVNEGQIFPEPEVIITDGKEQREIEMVLMPWSRSAGKLKDLPLSVSGHRGHYIYRNGRDMYHPQNLVDKHECYQSEYKRPAVGDWIVFKFEIPFIAIPKAILIRNASSNRALKSICLSLSVDGDEFEDFAVIKDIRKDKWKEQYFNLKDAILSNAKIWMTNYKFIKLKVLANWGGDYNLFYSFSVLGVKLKSDE